MPAALFRLLWISAAAAAVLLLLLNALLGGINHDEGWYLYAARLIWEDGLTPYRDFAFTQGPLMAWAYAPFTPLVERLGLLGGRLATAGFGLVALVLAARLSAALTIPPLRRRAALLAFTLLGVNVYQAAFFALPKTYALASVLLLGGWVLWVAATERAGRPVLAAAAGAVMAAAAGVRLSTGIALLPAFVLLLRHRRDLGLGVALAFAGGAALVLLALYAPFLWMCPEGLRHGLLEYHAARRPGGGLGWLTPKLGFLSRFAQAYFPLGVAFLVAAVAAGFVGRAPAFPGGLARERRLAVAVAAGLITLVHLAAPFPYDDYQVVVAPLLAALAALALAEACIGPPPAQGCGGTGIRVIRGNQLSAATLLLCLVAAFSSPINQDWLVLGRDRIWWRAKSETDLQRLRAAAAVANRWLGDPAEPLLTQDLVLAVEAGRRVPRGLEMGPFSLHPELDAERAAALQVVNLPMLEALLRSPRYAVAAASDWSFSIAAPAVLPLPTELRERLIGVLEARATETVFLPDVGQGHSGLRLYRLGPPAAP
jgi:hypothetical protein